MTAPKRDLWSWTGIWVVGATAAVWSFTSLSALAERVGIDTTIELPWVMLHTSWGLPLTVDVLAVVATRVWLRGEASVEAVRYARSCAWAAVGASVIGNAYHGWLAGGRLDTVLISAVPAVVIGVLVHLAVLVGRPVTSPTTAPAEAPDPPAERPQLWLERDFGLLRTSPTGSTASDVPAEPVGEVLADVNRYRLDDTEIVTDARDWAVDLGRLPSWGEMYERYRIGAGRCKRLRERLGWTDAPTDEPSAVEGSTTGREGE